MVLAAAAAAAAKSLQSCPTLCDPIDGSPPGSSVHGVLQARTLEWVAISFSSGPGFVRTPPYDPSVLGGPAWLLASLSYISPLHHDKAVIHERDYVHAQS